MKRFNCLPKNKHWMCSSYFWNTQVESSRSHATQQQFVEKTFKNIFGTTVGPKRKTWDKVQGKHPAHNKQDINHVSIGYIIYKSKIVTLFLLKYLLWHTLFNFVFHKCDGFFVWHLKLFYTGISLDKNTSHIILLCPSVCYIFSLR